MGVLFFVRCNVRAWKRAVGGCTMWQEEGGSRIRSLVGHCRWNRSVSKGDLSEHRHRHGSLGNEMTEVNGGWDAGDGGDSDDKEGMWHANANHRTLRDVGCAKTLMERSRQPKEMKFKLNGYVKTMDEYQWWNIKRLLLDQYRQKSFDLILHNTRVITVYSVLDLPFRLWYTKGVLLCVWDCVWDMVM